MNDSIKLTILLDLDSLKSESWERLKDCHHNDFFEFISLSESEKYPQAKYDDAKNIVTVKKYNQKGEKVFESGQFSPWILRDIPLIHKESELTYKNFIKILILKSFIFPEERNEKIILISEDKKILNIQNSGSNFFKDIPDIIFHPNEANIFIDLHCKRQNMFCISQCVPEVSGMRSINKGGWYLYSFKTKVSNFQKCWSTAVFMDEEYKHKEDLMDVLQSLNDRMIDMLIAIDEIGKNHYFEGVHNDTSDSNIYHFNYWITLFTGIIESLAWIAKYRYEISFENSARVGLRPKRQKEFMELVFMKNPSIKNFLNEDTNNAVLNLMYIPRDIIIHRSRLTGVKYSNSSDPNSESNLVKIPADFFNQIENFPKKKDRNWGQKKLSDKTYLLDPYKFSKQGTLELINFINSFLELLDFDEYLKNDEILKNKINENLKSSNKFQLELKNFKESHLGY